MGKINTMLSLDGEAQFRRQLNLINQNLKTLEKELQATSSELAVGSGKMKQNADISANYSKQLEFLKAKYDVLTKAVSSAEKELDANRNKLNQAQQAYQKSTTAVENQKKAIENATKQYGANSQQVKQLESELKKLESEQKKAAQEVNTAEKQVDRTAKAYHKYKQELADTSNSINKVDEAQRRHNTSAEKSKRTVEDNQKSLETYARDLDTATSKIKKFGDALESVGKAGANTLKLGIQAVNTEIDAGIKALETYAGTFGTVSVAIASFAASNGMSFESSMSKVKAYSGATEEEMVLLSAAAKEMGATTTKTATDAADALGYLALNGMKTEDMLTVLPSIVKASEAGTMDLATVANLTARSLNAYGKEATDASDFLNILIATQNNSSNSLYDLLVAYSDMAGTFRSLDIGMEESAAILGAFANQGTSGAEAATALSSVMLRLVGSNKKASAALEEVGVHAWTDEGQFRGLTTVLKDLGKALEDATPEKETLIEAQIGGVMRIQELKKLINGVMDDESFNNVLEPINQAIENQTMFKTAETMMDNLSGKVELLKSAISALGTTIYEGFGPDAANGVEFLSKLVNILESGVKGGTTTSIIDSIKAVSNRLSPELSKLTAKTAEELPGKLKIYNTAILEITKLISKSFSESKDTILPELITGATDLAIGVIDYLPQFTEDIADSAEILFNGIIDGMNAIADKLVDDGVMDKMIGSICDFFENNGTELMEGGLSIIQKLGEGIVNNLDEIAGTGADIINRLADDVTDNFPSVLSLAGTIIKKLVKGLRDKETLEHLVDAAVTIISSLASFVDKNFDAIIDECNILCNRIVEQLNTEENKEKMLQAGKALGSVILKGLRRALFEGWSLTDLDQLHETNERIDRYLDTGSWYEIPASDSIVKSDSSSGRISSEEININVSGNTINGYNDIQSMVEDMADAIYQAKAGGGRK